MYLQPLMWGAQMTWSSPVCQWQAVLLMSTLGHTGWREVVPMRLATPLAGIPAEILKETTKQPCQMLLGLHRALGQSDLLPQQGPDSGNRPLLHPNLPTGFAASLYSDVCWSQNFKYSRSSAHLGFTHLKLPLKCNPDELLGMDSSCPYCLQPPLGDCFQKGAE